jgi:hypothetical protein
MRADPTAMKTEKLASRRRIPHAQAYVPSYSLVRRSPTQQSSSISKCRFAAPVHARTTTASIVKWCYRPDLLYTHFNNISYMYEV